MSNEYWDRQEARIELLQDESRSELKEILKGKSIDELLQIADPIYEEIRKYIIEEILDNDLYKYE